MQSSLSAPSALCFTWPDSSNSHRLTNKANKATIQLSKAWAINEREGVPDHPDVAVEAAVIGQVVIADTVCDGRGCLGRLRLAIGVHALCHGLGGSDAGLHLCCIGHRALLCVVHRRLHILTN